MSGVSCCSCKHQKQNGGTGKPPRTLLVNTGHWESPTIKTSWRLLEYYSCCGARDHLWVVWKAPTRVLWKYTVSINRINCCRSGYWTHCISNILSWQSTAPDYSCKSISFSWNKDIRGRRQKVLPYLPVDTEGTKHSRICTRTMCRGSSTLLYSTSFSIMNG